MAHQIAAIPMTLSDRQGHYRLQAFSTVIFTAVQQLTRLQLT